MRKNFGVKSWVYPQPVLIIGTYDADGKPDAMNAAWGGQYEANQVMLCLGKHKTTDNIKLKGAFTVSFATASQVVAADYVGIVSAGDTPDKMEKSGFTTTKSEFVDAPLINELPLALECKFIKFNEDGNVIGEIVNVSADESILDAEGKIDAAKLDAIIFDPANAAYLRLGEKVGNAFADGNKLK
ncbi:MAG: flavin reductase family protein [Lachnospiraceae bacterium]|nr:flavin reductase family protein [Lachnospiraceae bacterium]